MPFKQIQIGSSQVKSKVADPPSSIRRRPSSSEMAIPKECNSVGNFLASKVAPLPPKPAKSSKASPPFPKTRQFPTLRYGWVGGLIGEFGWVWVFGLEDLPAFCLEKRGWSFLGGGWHFWKKGNWGDSERKKNIEKNYCTSVTIFLRV